ncbi:sensor histidine kinase [Clostridium sp. OS1-26]|uniref:sensor histidine kinase n=1 Tax=Clostridium sp. OS1-26 TaxID=3070681 RepID=UPI0027E0E091|nr:sensor histidine kinase [Clostridium sp. OS1-26]WML37433.1 sensor histidine kinase [Clostridium sp. OS1-26]
MYLIELMTDVLKNKSRVIIAYTINTSILIIFYNLLLDAKEFLYPIVISAFVLFIYLFIEMLKYKNFVSSLKEAKVSPDYQSKSMNLQEKIIFDTIKNIHDGYTNKLYGMYFQQRDKDTLFSQFIHNMKTSVTIIDLASQKRPLEIKNTNYLQDIREENDKLKINLEQCLNVLRLEDFSKDYVPEKVNLIKLVNDVINAKKRDFIYRRVYPKVYIDADIEVYTDKKWCSYMIDQILSNSIKYSASHENKKIYITSKTEENSITLSIRDEGIGIDLEDIPRVFEAFFTGNNGREYKNATGIGLYMVKLISEKLGHRVHINSKKVKVPKLKLYTFQKCKVM